MLHWQHRPSSSLCVGTKAWILLAVATRAYPRMRGGTTITQDKWNRIPFATRQLLEQQIKSLVPEAANRKAACESPRT